MIKKGKKLIVAVMAIMVLLNSSVYAGETYIRRNERKHLEYSRNGVKQEAFYDYGTPIPYDNARIYSYAKGSRVNYVSIKYSDVGLREFESQKKTTNNSVEAYVNYTSDYDYLDAGSYSYNEGRITQDLNVIK